MWAKKLQKTTEKQVLKRMAKKWLEERILPNIKKRAEEGHYLIHFYSFELYGKYSKKLVNKILREEGFEVTNMTNINNEWQCYNFVKISWRNDNVG